MVKNHVRGGIINVILKSKMTVCLLGKKRQYIKLIEMEMEWKEHIDSMWIWV